MNRRIKWVGLAITLLLIAFCAYQMSQRPLWAWWTLPLLLGIWASIVLLFEHRYNKRWLLLSTMSGLLLTFGFPISPLTALMFMGFVPLLIVEKEIATALSGVPKQAEVTQPSGRRQFLKFRRANRSPYPPQYGLLKYAFNAFVIWNIGTTWWVCNAGLLAGMVANYLNAFFMALAFWAFHKISNKQNTAANHFLDISGFKYLSFIAFWLSFEFLHLNWELSWPWLTLGNAFAQKPNWVQWYEYTGVFGGSVWILVLNVLIFKITEQAIYLKKRATRLTWISLLLLSLPIIGSEIIYKRWENSGSDNSKRAYAEVVSLQPNYEPHYEKFNVPDYQQMEKFLRLSLPKLDSTVDYLVLPETSFDIRQVDEMTKHPTILDLKNLVSRYPKLHLVTGIDAIKLYAIYVFQKPANLPPTVREHANRDGTFTYWEGYNAAIQIANGQTEIPFYKKSKLVPGPEILPYGFLFSWMTPLFKKFGGTTEGLGTQKERTAFKNSAPQAGAELSVGTAICYESIYGDFCRGYVQAGAQAIFVVTNDGWWDDTPGYQQHQKFASLRAIELRRSVVRSANTGSSCFVNLRGDIEQATAYGVDAAIRQRIPMNQTLTFYVRFGDWLAWLALGATLSLGLVGFINLSKWQILVLKK